MAARLRAAPVHGDVPGPTGTVEPVTMDVVGLVDLVNDAAGDPAIYRGLDAAARALLDAGDPAPLLRLYAQRLAFDEDYTGPARDYSAALYFAVSCLDYPQLFDMAGDEAARIAQLGAAEAALPGATFAPFTTAEWLGQNENTEAYSACVAWPSPIDAEPPTAALPPLPASIPVLILGGELDTWTPASGVGAVRGQLGGTSRFVELANATHVVGEGDTACGSRLVQTFVRSPQSLPSMDTSCAAAVPAIDAVGVYPESLAGVPPLAVSRSSRASLRWRRLGAAVVATAGDARARFADTEGVLDHGLHGGTARAGDGGRRFDLDADSLVPGVPVSGTVTVTTTTVSATLTARGASGGPVTFRIHWPLGVADATATVTGTSGGRSVAGTTPAP